MRNVPAGIASLLSVTTKQLATCWKCTLAGSPAEVHGFTDHDEDITVDGVVYSASTGYTRSAIASSSTLSVENLTLDGILDSEVITLEDIRAGLWDHATVEIFMVVWSDPTLGTVKLGYGTLGEVRNNGRTFVAELLGLTQKLQQDVGRIYGLGCDADVFDSRCGLNAASFTVTGSATSVTNRRQFTDTSRTEATGYFDRGRLRWTSGANNGLYMEVKTFASDVFILQLPMPFAVQAGDTYSVFPGCPKTTTACKTKFLTNNIVNYRGFPFMPGTDRMVSGGL